MKKIVLTGGGTAGHVMPNIALVKALKKEGFEIYYIGSETGIEKSLVEKEGLTYFSIPVGKLRRYLSFKNITDMFRVVVGIKEAAALIKKIKPDIVFSKGGFVAVPVVLGAKKNGVLVVIHESDMTPGLANKITMPFAKKICTTFPETAKALPKRKAVHTGTPIREELFLGEANKGLRICGFEKSKPVILMMGGSLGSVKINKILRDILPDLLKTFQVVHITGKGNISNEHLTVTGYKQFEFISDELSHIIKAADIIISRAGSNSIGEFLALKKPMLLIPLSKKCKSWRSDFKCRFL